MGYDPIRDAVVQSPMEQTRHAPNTWPSRKDSADGRARDNGRPGYPPAFHDHSPSGYSARSTAEDLRSILNDPVDPPRPSENGRSSSFGEEHGSFGHQPSQYAMPSTHGRTSIHGLLNSTPLAPPVSHSSSASSHRTSSPSNNSPAIPRPRDHPSLTPATPMSANPRFQSPYTSVSPASAYAGLPPDPRDPHFIIPDQPGPSRRSMTMDPYPARGPGIPYSQMYRSPSASESPRGMPLGLPGQYSRPGSSSSQHFQPPLSFESPQRTARVLSDDFGRRPVSRRESMPVQSATSSYSPSRPPMSVPLRSPSPPPGIPYNPRRVTQPTTVLQPITPEELSHLRSMAYQNNPLRRKKRPAPPSWSGPSSSARTPNESDGSYFPLQDHDRRRSGSQLSGRPSVTPGPGLPPAFEDASTSMERNGKGSLKRPSDAVDEEHDTARRKVSDSQYVGNAAFVADHYNSRPEVGVENRELSPIIGLKKFNNWVKSVLIGLFSHQPSKQDRTRANVLDIGCGKGGDLNKWKQAKIQLYVGMDIAAESIKQARDRYQTMHRAPFDGFFFAHDCYNKSIKDALPEHLAQPIYHNVSMQFCMHYAFESASKARMMIENVSRYLRPGGKFIGTVPDSELLLQKLNDIPEGEELRFGNACYSVQFEERKHKGIYGHSYHFFLEDAVDDVPEYIVNWDNFVSLASEYKLRLIYKKAFHEILQEQKDSRDFGPLLGRMGVIHPDGTSQMDGDQWEAANLYMAFSFEKY